MSRPPLIRQGEGQTAAIQRHHTQALAIRAKLETIQRELVTNPDYDPSIPTRATAAGDNRKLRGIPAHSRGVLSTIPGTDPLAALIAKEQAA